MGTLACAGLKMKRSSVDLLTTVPSVWTHAPLCTCELAASTADALGQKMVSLSLLLCLYCISALYAFLEHLRVNFENTQLVYSTELQS